MITAALISSKIKTSSLQFTVVFSTLTPMVERQEEHPAF